MKKDSIIDYSSYILLKFFGPLLRKLPSGLGFYLGRLLGDLFYYFDLKHRAIVYLNLKTAFAGKLAGAGLKRITRDFYRAYGQNIIEIFYIPLVDRKYINKYIKIEGLNYVQEGFKKGKGVILLVMHAGSWELSNIICASLGFPFHLFVRGQRYRRLEQLLNSYRLQKGCRIIQRQNEIRQVIRALKDNHAIGMTVDQGGRSGLGVEFFGKDASMSTGAIRLALKYGSSIIPVFYTRLNGPYVKVILQAPVALREAGNLEDDIRENLQNIVRIFEKQITRYPQEYLWLYKIWKYSRRRKILILSDAKIGHLRQSETVAAMLSDCLKDKGMTVSIERIQIKTGGKISLLALACSVFLSGKYSCQGCLFCLRKFLPKGTPGYLMSIKPDVIISCGSTLAGINCVLSRENLAKSIVIMRPPVLSRCFDLAIIPRHDKPPKRDNIVVTQGALNLIDEEYLSQQAQGIKPLVNITKELVLGLLIGGDAGHFRLGKGIIQDVAGQMKISCEKLDAEMLLTTSRRTPAQVEALVKDEFQAYPRAKLLVIANEINIPEAIGGILALSGILIVSPESISMVSEAAASGKYVVVFKSSGLSRRHHRFLKHLALNKYIYFVKRQDLSNTIERLWRDKPAVNILQDRPLIKEALKRLL